MVKKQKSDIEQIIGILEEFDNKDIVAAMVKMGVEVKLPINNEENIMPEEIKSLAEFSRLLKENRKLRNRYLRNPIELLEQIKMPEEVRSKIADFSFLIDALRLDFQIPNIFLSQLGNPVLQLGQKDEKQEDARDGQEGVIFSKPRTYHSVTRRDCHYAVIFRKSEVNTIVDADIKVGDATSMDVRTESTVKIELEKLLKSELTTEVKVELQAQYGISSATLSQVASMTQQEIERFVETLVTTHTIVVTIYTIPISGTITIQEVWDVEDHWNWVGTDCGDLVLSEADIIKYQVRGDSANYDVNTTIVIREPHAPSVRARGNSWAEDQAKETADRLIDRGAFLPEPPPASGVPTPLNIP